MTNNDPSVPINTDVVPNVPKITMNDLSVPKATQRIPTEKTLRVLTGVPNVKCAKVHQMYQNSLGMSSSDTDPIVAHNVTKNDPNVPKKLLGVPTKRLPTHLVY